MTGDKKPVLMESDKGVTVATLEGGKLKKDQLPDLVMSDVTGLDAALASKQGALTFDDDPKSGSDNPVKSGGVYNALQNVRAENVHFTDGDTFQEKYDSGELVGPVGPAGPTGQKGEDGKDGLPGEPGTPGEPGAPGKDGAAAGFDTPEATVDGETGTPSVEVTATGPDTSKKFTFAFHNLKGEKGDTGAPGTPGAKGDTGAPGKDGAAGAPGTNGANGKDGFSPTVATASVEGGTKVTITDASGPKEFTVTNGKDGAAGKDGSPGATGPQGPEGPNKVSTSTGTDITGLLKGNGETVEAAVKDVDYVSKEYVDGKIQYGTAAPQSLADGCVYLVYESGVSTGEVVAPG